MDQLEAHVIPDSNSVLLFLGGSFCRPFRVLYGTPANGAIVTLTSDQQGDNCTIWFLTIKMDAQDLGELTNESALTCCRFPCAIITLIVVDFILPIMLIDELFECAVKIAGMMFFWKI